MPGYANPQALNRYSYVLGNPLRYTDPSGHEVCDETGYYCYDRGQRYRARQRQSQTDWVDPVAPMVIGGGHDYRDGHPGVDLNPDGNANPNPAVVASSYGEVYSSTSCTIHPCLGDSIYTNDGYGNVVIVGYNYDALPSHVQSQIPEDTTLFMLYAHLQEPSYLQEGDIVIPGQPIGNVGTTGDSSGVHLHWEIRVEEDVRLPTGDIHIAEGPNTGFTSVHFTWHNWLTPLNPHQFFNIR